MKKRLVIILAVLLFFVPTAVFAAQFRLKDEQVNISSSETINDDFYVFAGNVRIDGTVNGELIVAGGQVTVTGKTTGDVFVGGGQVNIEGEVGNNLRVGGGNVAIRGKVGHDLMVGGGNVDISKDAEVKNDVIAGSGQLNIAGSTGKVRAFVGSLSLTSTAKINGDLVYTSDNDAKIESGAKISGNTTRKTPPDKPKGIAAFFVASRIISLLATILVALLFIFIFPNKSRIITKSWREKFGKNLLWGFLFLIAVPVAAVLLLITAIGYPLAIGAIILYVILLYLGKIAGIISLGFWVQNLGKKEKEDKPNWIFAVLAAVFYNILQLIPFVGWLGMLLIFLAGLGALIRFDWDTVKKLRSNKTI